jgi:hypothetical protein
VRFERLTAVTEQMTIFCYMTPCGLVYMSIHFGATCLDCQAAGAPEMLIRIKFFRVAFQKAVV